MSEVLMLNGKVYSRGDVSAKSLTYAEWLALPEDIRNTGMYFITDATAIGDSIMEFNANENGMNVGYYENGTKKEIMLPANVKDFAKKDLVTDLSTEPVAGSAVDANTVFNALGNTGGINAELIGSGSSTITLSEDINNFCGIQIVLLNSSNSIYYTSPIFFTSIINNLSGNSIMWIYDGTSSLRITITNSTTITISQSGNIKIYGIR